MLHQLPFRIVLTSALSLSLAVGPAILNAEQAPAAVPPLTIRANTRLVILDVVVTDKKGQPVTGLKPEDFSLEENGKKQKVSVFVAPGVASRPAPAQTPPGILSNHPENVTAGGVPTVLLLDAANSGFLNQAYARSQMLEYVNEQSHPGQPMAVVTLTDRLRVLQEFTSDPRILLAAIQNFKPQAKILQAAPPPPVSEMGGQGGAAIAAAGAAIANFANMQVGYNLERRTLITVDAMQALCRMLGGLPGRKNVVWLTADLPFDLIPEDRNISDAELNAELPGQGRQRSVSTMGAGSQSAEVRQLHGQEIKDAESQLASANVAIYPVDLRGLVGGMESLAARSEAHSSDIHGAGLANAALNQSGRLVGSQDTMREIAKETGGKAYMNENEVKQGVALAVADDQASYAIGYYPENKKWDGKYRNIKVKISQGDTEVRYRKGYFANEPGPSKDHNYEQDVVSALEVNAPATQVSFMAQTKNTDPGKVRVVFLVDAHTLSAEDQGGQKRINVNFYAVLYDANGKSIGSRSMKVDKAFDAATYQQILDKGVMAPIDMDLPGTAKEVRLAVLDNRTGYIGTVSGAAGQ